MEKFSIGMDIGDVITARNMNEIADAVNIVKGLGKSSENVKITPSGAYDGYVRVIYSGENLDRYHAVQLVDLYLSPDNCKTFESEKVTFSACICSDPQKNFAILAAPANNDEISHAVMIGVTPALVKIKDKTHNFAKPSETFPGYLESAESGPAKILWKSENNNTEICIVELGGSTGSSASNFSYNSYFKIVDISETSEDGKILHKIAVVDGGGGDGTVNYNVSMPWIINGSRIAVPQNSFEVSSSLEIYLAYDSDISTVSGKVVASTGAMPNYSYSQCYKHIGRVYFTEGSIRISQDFTGGIPETIWMANNCYRREYKVL